MKTTFSAARRAALALTTLVCLASPSIAANSISTHGASQDSIAYQINPTHTGRINFTNGFSAPLIQLWSMNLGGGVSYPLTADGMAFVTVGMNSSVLLEALNLSTGAVEWEKLLPGNTSWADAAYDHGTIFVINGAGQFVAFRAVSGKLLWSTQLSGCQYCYNNFSAPAARNGLVVEQYTNQNNSAAIIALDEATGATKWSVSPSTTASGGISGVAAMGGGGIFIGGGYTTLSLSPKDGSTVWSASTSCGPSDAPVLSRSSLYAAHSSCGNAIYDATTGNQTGSFAGSTAPVVQNKKAMLISLGGTLYSYSPKNDNVYWSFSGNGSFNTKPIVINSYVAALSSYGDLYLLDGSSGGELWVSSLSYGNNNYGGPDTGLGAGEGALLVPYGTNLYAFVPQNAH